MASKPVFDHVAAVDLGSNSFHMVVAQLAHGGLQVIDRIRERVAMAEGLGDDRRFSGEAVLAVEDGGLLGREEHRQRLPLAAHLERRRYPAHPAVIPLLPLAVAPA